MKNKDLRDMMAKLYRLMEKYESIPEIEYQDDADSFFETIAKECSEIYNQYNNAFAHKLMCAFYEAIGDMYKQKYEFPLKQRPREPEQITMKGNDYQ